MRRRPEAASQRGTVPGALVLGGDYRALGVVRSLGRRGIPVWVLRERGDHRLAALSRFSHREVLWSAEDDAGRADQLLGLAWRHGLSGWMLFPTADASAAFVARQHARLGECFALTTPPWDLFRWAYDKRCTAALARMSGIPHPSTQPVAGRHDVEHYEGRFPVILKPATKPYLNRPVRKAWAAENQVALLRSYDEAAAETEPGTLVLQEVIPGETHAQYSFAGLWQDGHPVASVTAERVRQYPPDFGRFSTFVQTVDNRDVEDAARRLLAHLRFTGLAEVEFKQDPRDHTYRLLDINMRVWGWHTIARRSGLDFPYLAWRLASGLPVREVKAPGGLRWLWLTPDAAAGSKEIIAGGLSPSSYLKSLLPPHERPVAAADDPLPGLAGLPFRLYESIRGRPRPTPRPGPRAEGDSRHGRPPRPRSPAAPRTEMHA